MYKMYNKMYLFNSIINQIKIFAKVINNNHFFNTSM